MTYRILQFLIVVLPFLIVPNKWDCFRAIKESAFQCSAIMILASSFFDIRLRDYKNKYLTFFLIYLSILFFRFFGIQYIWGGTINGTFVRTIVNFWNLMPLFNVLLGIIVLKVVIETISKEQLRNLIRLTCFVTFLVSIHLILQRFGVIQIYGKEFLAQTSRPGTGWIAQNRVIGFIGNPMLVGGYVAIATQFNLFFRNRLNYIFYGVGFLAVLATTTTSSVVTFLVCAFLFFIIYKRWLGILIGLVSIGALVGACFYDQTLISEKLLSYSDRIEVWKQTLKFWWEMPYTGMGLGNFRTHNILVKTTNWWQVHNEPLQILQETGLIGFTLVWLILIDFFKKITLKREVFVCGLVVVGGIVNSFMSFPLHIAPLVFVLILGFGFKEVLEREVLNG